MRRLTLQLCLLGPLGIVAPAADAQTTVPAEAVRRSELAAATQDALEGLRRQVLDAHLTPELTVRQFIDRVGGGEALLGRIDAGAEQRGGTRWRDEQTCEVRMALPGVDIADALRNVAAERRQEVAALNIRPESLVAGLEDLRTQTFSALGRSTGAGGWERIRPPAGAWRGVDEKDQAAAVAAARANAVTRVVESLRPLYIGGGKHMADVLDVPDLRDEIQRWLDGRPVTDSVFGDDLTVRLTLSAPPHELWPVVQSVLVRQNLAPRADDPQGWDALRQRVMQGIAPATGRAVLADARVRPNRAMNEPPRWALDQMNADGSVPGRGLPAARAAEEVALGRMRLQLEALPLAEGKTVGEAAKADPRVEAALAGALRRAQISKITYGRDAVEARVSLDLIRLWRELEAVR